jgi:hypothetical protein
MLHRFSTIVAVLALTLLVSGCHTAKTLIPPKLLPPAENPAATLKQAKQQLQQATPCCSSFADFSYQDMLPWQPQKFSMGSGSMVANLDGTHSYFLAFRLPADVKLPYRIAMKSELNGRWLRSSYLFAPTIVLLDAGFQPIRTDDVDLCEHMGWSDETSGALGSIEVSSDKARYLLIYSSAAQQSGKTYWEQSPTTFSATSSTVAAAPAKFDATGSFSVLHGPDGTLWVGMMNKAYAKAVDSSVCKKPAQGDGVLNTLRTALPLPWINDTNKAGASSGSGSGGNNASNNSNPG